MMNGLTHGFRIEQEKCTGCLACMRVCPTHAIRVKAGKAGYRADRCIDCGSCLTACSTGAIVATTFSVEDLSRFRFKVAVPSPVLFGQFPAGITPDQVADGLLALGFDAVWDFGVEIGLVTRAIRDYLAKWQGPLPLISIACPVVVRLVQVSYPRMVDQLINIQLPREIAAREAKRRYAGRLGISQGEIGVFYITPCQAQVISILQPAEGVESHLDGAVGIADVYNGIVTHANLRRGSGEPAVHAIVRNATFLRWSLSEWESRILAEQRCLHVSGLSNLRQVFEDIERGRLRNVDFLEAENCWSGCTGGNLTVSNVYLTLSKFHTLIGALPEMDPQTETEIERRYGQEDFSLERPIRPRTIGEAASSNLKEKVKRIREADDILRRLPGLDCGLCGAPTCRELAKDVSIGEARRNECVFLSRDRLQELRRRYLGGGSDSGIGSRGLE